ncbi:MAG TPA: hypothetical protein VF026_02630, partial [Ktedonobacteraceae bacterium]
HGRPRPVALAHILEEHALLPSAGDHEGPPNPTSTTLAPTDPPASFLTSRLSLMLIGRRKRPHSSQHHPRPYGYGATSHNTYRIRLLGCPHFSFSFCWLFVALVALVAAAPY